MTAFVAGVLLGYPNPVLRGHSHNDYEHRRPLWHALEAGMTSVEADIYLVDGELLVGHDLEDLVAGKTLSKHYLEPLAKLAREHGGRVYPDWPELILLVDIKSDGEAVYPYLLHELTKVGDVVGKSEVGAFRVVVSGDAPRDLILQDQEMWMAVDGRPGDLGKGYGVRSMPLISTSWWSSIGWLEAKSLPSDKRAIFKDLVERTHAEGKRIRFWALPDRPDMWELAWKGGVDLINTDRPPQLAEWVRARRK